MSLRLRRNYFLYYDAMVIFAGTPVAVTPSSRILIVPGEDRIFEVFFDDRVFTVVAEDRIFDVN